MNLIERDDPDRRWFIAVDKLTGKTLDVADRRSGAISGVEHVEVTFASAARPSPSNEDAKEVDHG